MGPVILFCNLIQHILCFYPFSGADKTFVASDGNNPFTNRFLGKKLGKLRVEERGILILDFHLVGLVISGKAMLPVKLMCFSK